MNVNVVCSPEPDVRALRQLLWALVRELIAKPGREEFHIAVKDGNPRLVRVVEGGKAKVA